MFTWLTQHLSSDCRLPCWPWETQVYIKEVSATPGLQVSLGFLPSLNLQVLANWLSSEMCLLQMF